MRKKLFILLLAAVVSVGTMTASNTQVDGIWYVFQTSTLTASVTYRGSSYSSYNNEYSGDVIIPTSVTYNEVEYSVTSIGEKAFAECTGLTSVTIPNSVTSIGNWAFNSCSSLISAAIPDGVISIGQECFGWCVVLSSIEIPNSVTSIGTRAFIGCSSISLPLYNSHVFAHMPTPYLGNYTIPSGIESIAGGAFAGCKGLTSITIPASVSKIGSSVFYDCTNLTSVVWNAKNCSNFGAPSSPFHYVDGGAGGADWSYDLRSQITSITFGNEVEHIPAFLCWKMTNLTSVTIPNSVASIGNTAFEGCSGLTSPVYNAHVFAYMPNSYSGTYTVPDGIESIACGSFSNCSGLTSITIPNSVTSIGENAFYNCSGLTSLKLSSMLEEPADYNMLIAGLYRNGSLQSSYQEYYEWLKNLVFIEAPAWFYDVPQTDWIYCPRHLQHVVVNNGELTESALNAINQSYKTLQTLDVSGVNNTEFADEAFKGYYNLQQLVLPEGLQKIGYMMVAECVNLQSIDIPTSVVEIDQRAFENCRSIRSVNFGENPSLTKIGNWAFFLCIALEDLEIPEGVTEIGDGAFYGCAYLKDLVLPNSVQSIGDNTFALCGKLQNMIVRAVTPPDIDSKTFDEVSRQIPVYVPDESLADYQHHPLWHEFFIQGISNVPTGIDNTAIETKTSKILRDGQIYILRGEKEYTITGQEVK